VEKGNPDLIIRDSDGKPYVVRYEAVNAMLLNEFLKAHPRIEEQDKRIDQLTVQLKGPFLIKLDTHGFEVPILRGAPATLLQTEGLIVIHGSSGDLDRDRAESKVRHRRFGN
jgi:hypothetical protein